MPLWAPTAALYAAKVILVAAAITYNSAQQKKMQRRMAEAMSGLDQGRSIMVRDPIAPRRIIYGQVEVSGSLPFIHVAGSTKEYLYYIVRIADHECEELGTIKLDDEVVPLDGSGNATGRFAGKVQIRKYLGLVAGERDTVLEAALPGIWTANHLGKSVARLHVRVTHDPELFPNGIPLIKCLVKGRKVYDFRTATTGYSANSALCTADYLMDPKYGKGIALARIISADVIEAANICDEDVVLSDTSVEDRYTCNGVINSDEEPDDVIADLAGSMAGIVCDPGGKWSIRAGAWRTPSLTLSEGDFVGAVSVMPRQSRQDTFNGVRGTFYSPLNQWAPADFPAVKNDTYMAWDGGVRLWRDVAYRFTTSHARAQRLAKIELERGRQQIVLSGPITLKGMQMQPGDVTAINFARYGWSAKPYEVINWRKVRTGTPEAPALAVLGAWRETAEGVWDWNDGEETTVDLAPNTTLTDPYTVPNVSSFSAAAAPSGELTAQPRVKLTWDSPLNALVVGGGITEIEYKKSSESDWTPWNRVRGDIVVEYVTDLQVGVAYDFRARHENIHGVHSPAWVTDSIASAPSGQGSYSGNLTNDVHGVSCDVAGTPLAGELGSGGNAKTDVQAWAGTVALTPVASAPGAGQFSMSMAVHSGTATITKEDNDTGRVDTLGSDSVVIRFTLNLEGVVTMDLDWTVWKNLSGVSARLDVSAGAVNKNLSAVYNPTTVTFYGRSGGSAYAGRFKIAYWNGSAWIDDYVSASDESSKVYTPPAGIDKFRGHLYAAGSFSTFLDEEIIPIVLDGPPGADGDDGIDGDDGTDGINGATILGSTGGASTINGTFPQAISGITVTPTVPAGGRYVTFSGYLVNASGTTNTCFAQIYAGASAIGDAFDFTLAPGASIKFTQVATETSGAGARNYQMYCWGSGAHNITLSGTLIVQ